MKKRYLPLVCFIGTFIFTFLASTVPLNGVTQADISNKFFTLLTPAGYTFSIWSVIYLSWFVVSLLIAFKDFKLDGEKKILFSISMVLTNLWLMTWHFSNIGMSLLIILGLLGILGFLFFDIKEDQTDWRFTATIELFMSWIMVASIVNFLAFLVSINSQGDGSVAVSIAVFLLLLGFIANIILLNNYKTYIASFVYIWALVGIWLGQNQPLIKLVCILFALGLLVNFIYYRIKAYKKALKSIGIKA